MDKEEKGCLKKYEKFKGECKCVWCELKKLPLEKQVEVYLNVLSYLSACDYDHCVHMSVETLLGIELFNSLNS